MRRIGKRIAIGMEDELWLVLHLMIAGRLHWRPPDAKLGGRQNLAAFDSRWTRTWRRVCTAGRVRSQDGEVGA